MKNILCYGDSNTWGNIAGTRNKELMLHQRYDRDTRWTGILQKLLGPDYYVIEGGLNGRNTSFDEIRFKRPSRNGLATLPLILEMNYPLDLVILMLGTNDVIKDYDASVQQTTEALQQMIRLIKTSHFGPNFQAPQVLLMAPAPIIKQDTPDFDLFYDDYSVPKSQQYAKAYAQLAAQENCAFLDAGAITKISPADGVHIDRESHAQLAAAIARKVKELNL